MAWVQGVRRIEVVAGAWKAAAGAVSKLVDVHGIKVCGVWRDDVGETEDLGFYQYAAIGSVIEFYQTAEVRCHGTSGDPGHGFWFVVFQDVGEHHPGGWILIGHNKPSFVSEYVAEQAEVPRRYQLCIICVRGGCGGRKKLIKENVVGIFWSRWYNALYWAGYVLLPSKNRNISGGSPWRIKTQRLS